MRRTLMCLLILVAFVALAVGQDKPAKTLDIYVVDVEGGNAVLFVTPAGEPGEVPVRLGNKCADAS